MADEEDKLKDKTSDFRQKVKTRTMLAFGVVGFLVDFFFTINISASQDILEATKIPTSLVLLATSGPASLLNAVYPYFFQRIAVSVASCVIFIFSVTGMLGLQKRRAKYVKHDILNTLQLFARNLHLFPPSKQSHNRHFSSKIT